MSKKQAKKIAPRAPRPKVVPKFSPVGVAEVEKMPRLRDSQYQSLVDALLALPKDKMLMVAVPDSRDQKAYRNLIVTATKALLRRRTGDPKVALQSILTKDGRIALRIKR